MKPSFALDLNPDGIGLVHRGKDGWQLVGKVALDDPDLSAALTELRDTATTLGSGVFATKLIVPGTQILFTSMTAPGPDDITREARIREGLDGLTPYPVEDLVFDWQPDDSEEAMVHVAVVARDTLDEALSFAQDHAMNPLGFVARPKGAFSGEVFFGSLEGSTTVLDREKRPVPKLLDTEPVSIEMDAAEDEEAPLTLEDPTQPPAAEQAEPEPPASPTTSDIPELAPFPPTPDVPVGDVEDAPTPRPAKKKKKSKPKRDAVDKPVADPVVPKAPTPEPAEPEAPVIGFSSTRTTEAEAEVAPEAPAEANPLPAEPRLSLGLTASEPAPETNKPAIPPAPPSTVHVPVTAPVAFETDPKPSKTEKAKATAERGKEGLTKAARKGAAGLTAAAERASAVGRQATSKIPSAPTHSSPSAEPDQKPGRAKALSQLSGQLLRKGRNKPASAAEPQVTAVAPPPITDEDAPSSGETGSWTREAEALTIFGARKTQQVGGKPRFLALYLILGLLIFLGILILWSMLFLSDTETTRDSSQIDQFEAAIATAQSDADEDEVFGADSNLIDPSLVEGDEALGSQFPEPLSEEAAQARYAATGIWQRAPEPLNDATTGRIDDLYVASIDPQTVGHDAVALTPFRADQMGGPLPNTNPPPPLGTVFNLDERGFVEATPEGALTPEGAVVIAGRPDVIPAPAPRPEQSQTASDETATDDATDAPTEAVDAAPTIRPRARPDGITEGNERLLLGGRTRTELAQLRPRGRPDAIIAAAQEQAQAQADAIAAALSGENAAAAGIAPTALAVSRSTAPKARPSNFSRIVAQARPNGNASDGSVAVAAAPQTTGPAIPTRASVAKQATIKNAINLRKVSLIGIYGPASSRRALVRMPSGRYVKVGVGSRLDGGKVVSISTTKLIYQKGGRTVTLNILPFG
ncbi:hypothetical protein [Aliiroseovarius marinus]|uniref:hypothetical protein n=1 Tax=Aliiroseovarius marinus TaxID=2500159 RepID=UPI002491EE95|nr:hypothetical protein [Aliiroseovarius marinus]